MSELKGNTDLELMYFNPETYEVDDTVNPSILKQERKNRKHQMRQKASQPESLPIQLELF